MSQTQTPKVIIDKELLEECDRLNLVENGDIKSQWEFAIDTTKKYGNCKRKHRALINIISKWNKVYETKY